MAFALRDTVFLDDLRARSTSTHVLIVERFDTESATGVSQQLNVPKTLRAVVPAPLRRFLKKLIHLRRSAGTGFADSVLERLQQEYPQYRGYPVLAQDISSHAGFTFEQFTQAIVDAAVVITTRLHVATLAAMLGKRTFVVPGTGSYSKIVGCYEHSMADLEHVSLWPWAFHNRG
jgi:exopolysaccharide biosynthesis predicted pyruvyltransferase EpsI